MTLGVYLVIDGEQHWYAAHSKSEAIEAHLKLSGDEYPELEESLEVTECDLDKPFTIYEENVGKKTKVLREWLAECKPGDMIASSVF